MTTLVDTSILIDLLRGVERAKLALERSVQSDERIVASVLTRLEVRAGMRPGEEDATERLLDTIAWVAVDEAIADEAGRLAARYLRSHPGIDAVDYVIAATTSARGARLWTRNVKHFPMFDDLRAPY